MRWQIEPMPRWPHPEKRGRRTSPFTATWQDTLDLLEHELDELGVRSAVAMRVVGKPSDVRLDGMLRTTARLDHPGVILSFESRYGPLSYPCDTFTSAPWRSNLSPWQVNVRAVALALEALRKVDRYGVTRRGEQYTGWRAIEAAPAVSFASVDEADQWLRSFTGATEDTHRAVVLNAAAVRARRNRESGDQSTWDRYRAARELLEAEGTAS